MKTGLILAGGSLNLEFAGRFLEGKDFYKIIAVDGGLAALKELCLVPDAIVGDFDTVDHEVLNQYRQEKEILWDEDQPEKDETDSELAIRTAVKLGCDSLVMLGATGGRMDHAIGNIHLLYSCLKQGIKGEIVDEKNRLYLIDGSQSFRAISCYGKYISFLPLTEQVKGITLRGFKYSLTKKDIEIGTSLCISNELTGEVGTIEFDKGVLICIESHD